MNFYLLVEGERCEPAVYAAWLAQWFPMMSQVKRLAEVQENHYFIVKGGGQPEVMKRITDSIQDIVAHGNIDRFFVCLDAESMGYDERLRRVRQVVDGARTETKIKERMPKFREHIIIQNVCIETWFLGNVAIVEAASAHSLVKPLRDGYDVTNLDPEHLPHDPRFKVRAQFHKHYLKQVLHARNRKFPGIAQDSAYTHALRDRCATTNHLRSLQRLFDVLADP